MSYDCDILRENIFNLPIQFDQLLFILVIESAFRPSLFFRFDSVLCFVYATKKKKKPKRLCEASKQYYQQIHLLNILECSLHLHYL